MDSLGFNIQMHIWKLLLIVTKFVRIGIADKNDSPPYFDRFLYETEIDENADLQTTVLTVNAKDQDDSTNIRYQITGGNIGNAFAVQNTTGAIYIANPLDYETRPRYELRLEASRNRKTNFTTVIINVRDVNDNPPVFDRLIYRTQITEEDDRNLPKRILQVTATDGDVDRPMNIVYFLTGQGIDPDNQANSKFDINRTTGDIFVLKPLDRDQPNGRPQWRFTVFAQDEGGEGLVGYADIQVNLKDINDNAPQFPQGTYYGNITENGTAGASVMTMAAIDYDDPNEGTNAKLVYSIEKNVIEEETGAAIFEIESDTGVIKTAVCCLDRERTPDYSIQVVAMDGGGLKGTGTASIRVKDLNDMPPQFTKDEWFTEVDETNSTAIIPETPILTVTVQDEDETNTFHYRVVPNSGFGADKFVMVRNSDGTGSLKIVQPLDYEDPMQSSGFRFRIQVNDMGDESGTASDKYHVAYSWVVVKLRDINDNDPHFERDHIEVAVYEDTKVGTILEQFKATDADQAGHSRVSYRIVRSTNRRRQFAISAKGAVSIQRALDRETADRHHVRVLAVDDGSPARTATATLTVIVKDVNDNAPVFAKNYRPVLPENVSPRQIIDIAAIDADDRLRGNAGPFTFRLAPSASDIIRASFKVDQDRRGDNGNGIAIVSSLRPFDREQQKAYLVPIEIKDNGSPTMTGTSTLTVIIGDVNDNKMSPGSKDVLVYNYQGQSHDTPIGRVYVHDPDDWDVPDKKYYWETQEHQRFKLDTDTGLITMRAGTRRGRYQLRFKVYDREQGQVDIPANMTVNVRDITQEAVQQAGSMRLAGITDEDFVRVWDYTEHTLKRSKLERFRDKLAELLYTDRDNVDVFSVQLKSSELAAVAMTDVHFAARSANKQPYFKAVRLNGIVLMHREEIEKEVGLNITMVAIDECLYEQRHCAGSCTSRVELNRIPYTVSVNKTALVGVRLDIKPECVCKARNFSRDDTCRTHHCFNGGRCVETRSGPKCVACPVGYNGPRCQQSTRSFRGNGWAWYPPLQLCEESHLSLEFITKEADGLILYNGPIVPPKANETVLRDFIAVELEQGFPRLLLDFGSGTLELRVKTKKTLDDGVWHRLDIFWDTENVRMVVDFCRTAEVYEMEDGSAPEFDDNSCQARGQIPPFNEALNLNVPLQLGGLYRQHFDQSLYRWQYAFTSKGFDGCIRNVIHNSEHYDLAFPALARNSYPACPQTDEVCLKTEHTARCWEQGNCVASMVQAKCHCRPGWTGPTCNIPTTPTTFKAQSYVKFALSFEPDRFSTQLQLRFRSRERQGEIFRVSDQHQREYAILELRHGHLQFRYNLNSLRAEERQLQLSAAIVNDGQWHVARVYRYGSAAILEVDGGEGSRYNETFHYEGHQWLSIDKQEGVYAGGKAEYTGVKTFEVQSDFQRSCLDDIRLDGKHLPLPPSMNGTQWGQATMARNLERNCPSNRPCSNVICPDPFDCVDLWNEYECTCSEGRVMSSDTKGCVDRNECLDLPCLNGATCINLEPRLRYRCICPEGYWGENCELVQEGQRLKLSMGALGAIFVCLIIILILALIFVIYSRKRKTTKKKKKKRSGPEKDVRETVINYDDEGGGEDDMTAFDITPLQIPVGAAGAGGVGGGGVTVGVGIVAGSGNGNGGLLGIGGGVVGPNGGTIIGGGMVGTMPPDIAACKVPIMYPVMTLLPPGQELNVGYLMEERKKRIDRESNAPPFDDLRNFTFEGSGSIAESLSSLASGTDDENQDFKYLEGWGPRFNALATMYIQPKPPPPPPPPYVEGAANTAATATTTRDELDDDDDLDELGDCV